ncbi:MAG: hypothetical protein GY941_20995 [Planctomycetes bacterium]|nr:hypothetical protein [Planctomycetota bacterium]
MPDPRNPFEELEPVYEQYKASDSCPIRFLADDTREFSRTIQVGVGASDDKLKHDDDILFATGTQSLLFSDGKIYYNDRLIEFEGLK